MLQLDLQETASGDSSMFRTVTIYVSLSVGALGMSQLTVRSTRPKLYHSNHRVPHS